MIRLRRDDFNDPHELAKFAATAGMSLQEFRQEFEYLVTTSRRRSRWTRGWAGSSNRPPHRGRLASLGSGALTSFARRARFARHGTLASRGGVGLRPRAGSTHP